MSLTLIKLAMVLHLGIHFKSIRNSHGMQPQNDDPIFDRSRSATPTSSRLPATIEQTYGQTTEPSASLRDSNVEFEDTSWLIDFKEIVDTGISRHRFPDQESRNFEDVPGMNTQEDSLRKDTPREPSLDELFGKERVSFEEGAHVKRSPVDSEDETGRTSVVVVPRVFGSNINVLAEMQRLNVDLTQFRITVLRVFPSGTTLLRLQSEEEVNYLRRVIETSDTLVTQRIQMHTCQVRIHNIPNECTESEIFNYIFSRFHEAPVKIQFLPYNDERNRHEKWAKINVGPTLMERIETFPSIQIGGIEIGIHTSVRLPRYTRRYGETQRPHPLCRDCTNHNLVVWNTGVDLAQLRNADHPTNSEGCPTKTAQKLRQQADENAALYDREKVTTTVHGDDSLRPTTSTLFHNTCVLVVPKIYGSNVNVLAAIQQLNIDFTSLRVMNKKLFPSGVVLLHFASQQEADYVKRAISKSEIISVGSRKIRPCYVQLQHIPKESTESEIYMEMYLKFGETPTKVQFLPHETVRIYVDFPLWKKMEAFPSLVICGQEIKIDTSATVERCSKCRLLGHDYGPRCFRPARPAISPYEPCLDCSEYNKSIATAGLSQMKFKDTSHPTDDENCPSKRYHIAKWERHQQALSLAETGTNETRRAGDSSGKEEVSRPAVLVVSKLCKAFDVLAEMQRLNIDLESLQITEKILFPSGAALLVCKSEEEVNKLKKIIEQSGTLMTKSEDPPFSRRVYIDNIPKECTTLDISREMCSKYDETPKNIFFSSIREMNKYEKMAIIEVTSSLLKKMNASPDIRICGLQYKIDTSLRVVRCNKCQLLGHTSKKCLETPRPPYSPLEPCLDCCNHNKRLIQSGCTNGPLIRNVNHPTNDILCSTKRYFMERMQRREQAWSAKSIETEFTDEFFF